MGRIFYVFMILILISCNKINKKSELKDDKTPNTKIIKNEDFKDYRDYRFVSREPGVNIMESPDDNSEIVVNAEYGLKLEVLEISRKINENWFKVNIKNKIGWIPESYALNTNPLINKDSRFSIKSILDGDSYEIKNDLKLNDQYNAVINSEYYTSHYGDQEALNDKFKFEIFLVSTFLNEKKYLFEFLLKQGLMNDNSEEVYGSVLNKIFFSDLKSEIRSEMLNLFFEYGGDNYFIFGDNYTYLQYLIFSHKPVLLRYMLQKGLKIENSNSNDHDGLRSAVENDNNDCAEILLEYGAEIDNGIITRAVINNNVTILPLLLEKCTPDEIKSNSREFIHYAVINEHIEALEILLKFGADINYSLDSFYSETPIYNAIQYKNDQLAVFLIKNGSDCNKIECGESLFHKAVENGMMETVDSLLDKGFDINSLDEYGYSPLMIAANTENNGLLKLLLDHGADTNIFVIKQGEYINNALSIAVFADNEKNVLTLLVYGADPSIKSKYLNTNENNTLYDYARMMKMNKIASYLKKYMNMKKD
jgi:ankyrin repeat protein